MNSVIICQKCGTKNSSETTLCVSCNQPLGIVCRECNAINSPLLNYCEKCGATFNKITPPADIEFVPQRLHLNIMFCDLVGSTDLSEALDPEIFLDIVVAYQEVCAKAIEEQGGYIAQYLGDGILVYFGYPKTFEDNSQRAVQAALNIVENLKSFNENLIKEGKPVIELRIGIHTGLVVMGEVGSGDKHERLALGDTPNIASRIQSLAEPNQILISAETYKIVQKIIYCIEKGTHPLKGITDPVTVYQPISVEIPKSSTTEQTNNQFPLIGQQEVIMQLNELWEKVLTGELQSVFIRGDIGVGKTHVINYFTSTIADAEAKKIFFKCTSYSQSSLLFPFVSILNMLVDIENDETDETKLSRIEKFLAQLHFNLDENVPVICALLSVPLTSKYKALSFSNKILREKTLVFFKNFFIELSKAAPALIVIEDVQYADKLSLELINQVCSTSANKIFFLLSCRKEFEIPADKNYKIIDVLPLEKKDSEKLALQIAGKKLPDELLQMIIERTQGVPLFIEELLNVILDSDVLEMKGDEYLLKGALPEMVIPATLQDLLFSKLDKLGKENEIAQLVSVYGREITPEMLQEISGLDSQTVSEELKTLVDESVFIVKGRHPHLLFGFKQALMQEKAYQLLLISKRQEEHLRIAEVLENKYEGFVKSNPGFVANHFTLGEKIDSAIAYLNKAGQLSLSRFYYEEAIDFFNRAIELLPRIENESERKKLETLLNTKLQAVLLATNESSA
ncbi:MAG: AAA family ATPase [Chitinophagales bacterium]|nr:AAA family ATPase [Chitinophagales bacterium]